MKKLQLIAATITVLVGLLLLLFALWVPPVGEIHSSVLVAFGEVATFAGSLFGIDYHYRYGMKE